MVGTDVTQTLTNKTLTDAVANTRSFGDNTTLSGTYTNKNYDLSIISHVEPFDLENYTRPDYYWGYKSEKFNKLFEQIKLEARPADRSRLLGEAQRLLAEDAANVYLYQPQWVTIAAKNVRGLWKDMPIFINDLSSMYWA